MDAQRRNASALRFKHSQSLASRRQRFSQPMVLSTIQRLGNTANLPTSERLTISTYLSANAAQSLLEFRPLIAVVGVELQQERKPSKQRGHQQHAAVTVLNVCRVDDALHQQALRINEDMSLFAFDLLGGVKPMRVREPPFSALLTLWLSIMPAVGLASRPASSRHWT